MLGSTTRAWILTSNLKRATSETNCEQFFILETDSLHDFDINSFVKSKLVHAIFYILVRI